MLTSSWAGFPNIYTGCEYDGADASQLCSSGHGTPIRLSSVSKDQSSISYHMPFSGFTGNSSYDLWFNRSGGTPHGRDNGAEIMIWLGSDGLGAPVGSRKVKIDGIWFGYDYWSTTHSGGSWNYIRYWRLSGYNDADTSVNLNLLPFFRDAESAGSLSSSCKAGSVAAIPLPSGSAAAASFAEHYISLLGGLLPSSLQGLSSALNGAGQTVQAAGQNVSEAGNKATGAPSHAPQQNQNS